MVIDAADARRLFRVPGPGPYALTHSVGCLTEAAAQAVQSAFLQPWAERGGSAWPDWLARVDHFRQALAALLGGDAAQYCPQPGVTAGLVKLLGALPPPAAGRNVVVASEDAFPSLGFALQQAARSGFSLRLMPRELSPGQLDTWRAALAADVTAVLVTHVHSNTGVVAPAQAIAALCRERDIVCIVDVAQSAGILPLDVADLNADIVLGSCIKWLCGGPGAGFLWVNPGQLPQLAPQDVGWFSHADPFEFDIHHFEYAPDALRFLGGTPSIAPPVMATASLDVLRTIGVANVLTHNRRMRDALRDELPPDWRRRLPEGDYGGTLCLPLGTDFERITRNLQACQVRFDARADTVRLSLHLCNSEQDARQIGRAFRA